MRYRVDLIIRGSFYDSVTVGFDDLARYCGVFERVPYCTLEIARI